MKRYRRTRTRAILPWVGVGLLAVTVGFGVGNLTASPGAPAPASEPSRADEPKEPAASPDEPSRERDQAQPDRPLITKDVTVQILNGSGSRNADDRMLKRLLGLGYHVLVINPARHKHDRTSVLWSTNDSKEAAAALAARFGWRAEPAPRNLSDSVTTHVVVGADEA